MRVHLTYMVPVNVEVDTEDGTVESVIVQDEAVRIEGDGDPWSVYELDDDDIARARDIAENGEWPSWEIG